MMQPATHPPNTQQCLTTDMVAQCELELGLEKFGRLSGGGGGGGEGSNLSK